MACATQHHACECQEAAHAETLAELERTRAKLAAFVQTCADYNKRYHQDYQHLLDLWGELWRLADARGDTSTGLASAVADRGRAYVEGLRADVAHWRSEYVKATAVVEFAHAALSDAGVGFADDEAGDEDLILAARVYLLGLQCSQQSDEIARLTAQIMKANRGL